MLFFFFFSQNGKKCPGQDLETAMRDGGLKIMPSHFHHNLGNINKKEPCCNHQSGCDSQKATECELFNTPHNFRVCAL